MIIIEIYRMKANKSQLNSIKINLTLPQQNSGLSSQYYQTGGDLGAPHYDMRGSSTGWYTSPATDPRFATEYCKFLFVQFFVLFCPFLSIFVRFFTFFQYFCPFCDPFVKTNGSIFHHFVSFYSWLGFH